MFLQSFTISYFELPLCGTIFCSPASFKIAGFNCIEKPLVTCLPARLQGAHLLSCPVKSTCKTIQIRSKRKNGHVKSQGEILHGHFFLVHTYVLDGLRRREQLLLVTFTCCFKFSIMLDSVAFPYALHLCD